LALLLVVSQAHAESRTVLVQVKQDKDKKASVTIYSDEKKEQRSAVSVDEAVRVIGDMKGWGSSVGVYVTSDQSVSRSNSKRLLAAINDNPWLQLEYLGHEVPKVVGDHFLKREAKQISWGKPVSGIRCAMELKGPLERSVLEPIFIKCHTKNQSGKAVELFMTHPLGMYQFDVTGPDGKAVPLTMFGRLQKQGADNSSIANHVLKPGGKMMTEIHFNRLYDMTKDGKYRISFSGYVPDPNDPDKFKTVTSNVLTITIREAE
jgi:hypothetical protein